MSETKSYKLLHREFLPSIVLYHVMVLVMMGCLGYAIQELGSRLLPAWENHYLLPLVLFVTVEAMATGRLVHEYYVFSSGWFASRFTEWIVLLVLFKAFLYLLHGPAQILKDVLLWDEDFFNTFFTPEYMAIILISIFIWLIASQFISYLLDMEESVEELDLESQGVVIRDRKNMHRVLAAMIFGVGLMLLILIAFVHIDLAILPPSFASLRGDVLVLLLYFLVGFFLLAQSEFFVLRARWYLQNIPASQNLGARWALYSLILLLMIAAVVALLPTGYTGALFRYIQIGVALLLTIVSWLVMLIITPVLLLIQLLSRNLTPTPLTAPPIKPPDLPPPGPFEPDIILQLLRSLIFWTIFLSIIVFSFRFYLSQRKDWVEQLKKRRATRWLGLLIEWLQRRWRRAGRRVESAVESAALRLRQAARASKIRFPGVLAVTRRLPPRTQVLLLYIGMLRWNEQNGLPRKRTQSPAEYALALTQRVPAGRNEIDTITHWFVEARYTRHEIHPEDAERVREDWSKLKRMTIILLNTGSQEQQ